MYYDVKVAFDALKALRAECDASIRFLEWYVRNPGVYVGLSHEGRQLLCEWLQALDWFSETHPWADTSKKRLYLLSLFDDLPPKSPNEFPCNECQNRHSFFLYTYNHANV